MSRLRSRNAQEKSERRDAILDSAMRVFFARGFEKSSMDDIARDAGLSRSLLYVYFKDKDDIHMGLCVRAGQTLARFMAEEIDQHERGIDRVKATGQAYYRFYRQEPGLFSILSMRLGKQSETVGEPENITPLMLQMQEVEEQIMTLMVSAIESGLKDHSVDRNKISDSLQTAMFLRGSLHGVIMLTDVAGSNLFDRVGLVREALIDYGLDTITESLALVDAG
ncbi:MAG: TetR/AcrR family transcriptional regulator [Candidatus Pelagadaptatus aseana]|uniref:TetR/AcrR family transcriptional regulator n=1 Tax=Candidatus Pelagadaptatus aseana TaxID=3120508 RepID=UPI0039B25DEE